MEESHSSPPPAVDLASLEPDAFAAVCQHISHRDVAALASSSAGLRHAVAANDTLWSGVYSRQFPEPWQRLTQPLLQPPQQQRQQSHSRFFTTTAGGWRDAFLRTHAACQQLRSSAPACRQWTTDSTPVHLASIHGSGAHRLTLAAQGSTVELCSAPSAGRQAVDRSIQCYGHTARVSAAAVIELGGAARRVGIATASHDQTIRLWAATADPESYQALPLTLLTPLRTLRGHVEAVTCLHLISGSTGVTIAATGSKDRTVRLWGLAPLLPSPVQKPQVAILRGHGGPVTCLAMSGGCDSWAGDGGWNGSAAAASGSPATAAATGQLMSGSLDGRVKSWDPWTAACIGTAKCAAAVTGMQAVAANPSLQPHTLLVASGSGAQLVDARVMRGVAAVAFPAGRSEQVHSCAQWGWDMAVGSSGGARVFDMRVLTGSGEGGGGGSSSSSSSTMRERLRLNVDARPITSIHVDRWKVLTATDRYGEAPLRAWCVRSGECLAELDSCLPAAVPARGSAAQPAEGADDQDTQLQHETETVEQQEEGVEGEVPLSPHQPQERYRGGWAGVTALACRGALLTTGNADGTVCERDYSRGGLPELDGGGGSGGDDVEGSSQLAGKFWRYTVLES